MSFTWDASGGRRARRWVSVSVFASIFLALLDGSAGAGGRRGTTGLSEAAGAATSTAKVGAARRASSRRAGQVLRSVVNANARIAPRKYTRPHARGLDKYRQFLGREFTSLIERIKPGEVWIDSGGGLGVAALEGALSKQVVSYVINAQDFWRAPISTSDALILADTLPVDLTGVSAETRETFKLGAPPRYRAYQEMNERDLAVLTGQARRIKNEARRAGRFHYLVGFAEHRLPTIGVRARVVTDLYGAYFYSGDRAHLLDLYYDSLAAGGVAYIRTRTQGRDGLGPRSIVKTSRGDVPLERYLVDTFPDVFRYSRSDRGVLIMRRKVGGPDHLGLAGSLPLASSEIVNLAGMEVPNSVFRERPSAARGGRARANAADRQDSAAR